MTTLIHCPFPDAKATLKAGAVLLARAIARLEALHPYETPAIMGWRCDAAGSATQDWLGGLLRPRN